MELIIDIESDSLMELVVDGKQGIRKECSTVHCVVTLDVETRTYREFTSNDCFIGLNSHLAKATKIIGHNILGFDLECLRRMFGFTKWPEIHDSLIVSKLMYPDLNNHPLGGNSLECWGKHLGIHKINYQGTWDELTDDMLTYCKQDVAVALAIYQHQKKWIADNNYAKIVKLEHMASAILLDQTTSGFGFNLPEAEQLIITLRSFKAGVEDDMRGIFPDKVTQRWSEKTGKRLKDSVEVFNPGSRKQIAERLYDKYKWVAPQTENGNPNVDADVLKELDYPEAKILVEYFDVIKLLGQVEDWVGRASHSRDGRIHGYVNVQGASTGRCTHSQPNIAQVSGDHRARQLWIPYKDHVLLGSDLSGLELRMLAHYMHKYDGGAYGDVILNGDIHKHNQLAAGLKTRDMAKTFIYGFLYGAGDAKIGKIVDGSSKQGAALKAQFLKELPALAKVKKEVEFLTAKHGYVILPDGRRAPVRSAHAALNTLLQGAGAVVSKYWMILANRNLEKAFGKGSVIQLAYVHDELQFSCPPGIADEAGKIIVASATEAGERLGINMRIDAAYQTGSSWAETH